MKRITIPDRRKRRDGKTVGTYRYTGIGKRTGNRLGACMGWDKIYSYYNDLYRGSASKTITIECRDGICSRCSLKRFPQYYPDR